MEKIPEPPVLTLDPNDDNIILEIPEDKDPNEKVAEPVKKEKVLLNSKVPVQNFCFSRLSLIHNYFHVISTKLAQDIFW